MKIKYTIPSSCRISFILYLSNRHGVYIFCQESHFTVKCGSFYREITTKNDFGNTEITNMGKMQKLHNHTRPIKYYMCIRGFCGVTNENHFVA